MTTEAEIQVALDGSGKKVKNFLLTGVVQADGTSADVYVQCVSVMDDEGRLVDFMALNETMLAIYREVKLMRQMVGEVTQHGGALGLGDDGDPAVNEFNP